MTLIDGVITSGDEDEHEPDLNDLSTALNAFYEDKEAHIFEDLG